MASKLRSRVPDDLAAGPVEPDVVGGPAGAELIALGRELADQLDEVPIAWIGARFGAEHGGDVKALEASYTPPQPTGY
jgi:hypothetical protein